MKKVTDERILKIVSARRKGRWGNNQTEFELGVGYSVTEDGKPTGKVVIRTEQVESGVPPVVAILDAGIADDLCLGLIDAIGFAKEEIGEVLEVEVDPSELISRVAPTEFPEYQGEMMQAVKNHS